MNATSLESEKRVLLIDGDTDWLSVAAAYLAKYFIVETATNIPSALHVLSRHTVDAVISDATLEDRTAAHLYTALARVQPGLEESLVVATCGGFDEGLQAFLRTIPNPILYKSFALADLWRAVEEIMNGPQSHIRANGVSAF